MRKIIYILLISIIQFTIACETKYTIIIDKQADWKDNTLKSEGISIEKSNNLNGVIDLMGNGALSLEKQDSEKPFQKTSKFKENGIWTSKWQQLGNKNIMSIETEIIIYGNDIDIRSGWIKFSGNPIFSGENELLPLNTNNTTDQTILLPAPGGVPQDQSILLGTGKWEGKWLLFFNHTPSKWPYNYYWSFAVSESLEPFKRGINPFQIDTSAYPLFGPINGQAPNDWLEVNGIYYAPDETYDGESHMWMSNDIIHWKDLGEIKGILGSDPGLVYDGIHFYLFNENGNYLTYNILNNDFTSVIVGDTILNVGEHTGDPDLGFFNNKWHMFFDDGEHLHYNIGYAVTTPEEFPNGWKLENKIYGPYNPDQGQKWDNDNKEGNDFGTGDADLALEHHTLYLFTERPIGVAYREITEILKNTGQNIQIKIEFDHDGDYKVDSTSEWIDLKIGNTKTNLTKLLRGEKFRILVKINSSNIRTSPLMKFIKIEYM